MAGRCSLYIVPTLIARMLLGLALVLQGQAAVAGATAMAASGAAAGQTDDGERCHGDCCADGECAPADCVPAPTPALPAVMLVLASAMVPIDATTPLDVAYVPAPSVPRLRPPIAA